MSIDLTIEGALADPMIAAAMRADHVDPQRLEDMLRTTARHLRSTRPAKAVPLALLADRVRGDVMGSKPAW